MTNYHLEWVVLTGYAQAYAVKSGGYTHGFIGKKTEARRFDTPWLAFQGPESALRLIGTFYLLGAMEAAIDKVLKADPLLPDPACPCRTKRSPANT